MASEWDSKIGNWIIGILKLEVKKRTGIIIFKNLNINDT